MNPTIDILLPSYNPMPFLPERLDSIFVQTYTDWTLRILDSHSNDGSKELYDALEDERITVTYGPREGIYPAWNRLLADSKHDWIYIATADDSMYPQCLERCMKALVRYPDADVLMFGIDVIDGSGRKLENWHSSSSRPPRYTWGEDLKKKTVLPGRKEFLAQIFACGVYQSITGMLFSRKALEATGPFPNEFGSAGDTFWVMELMRKHDFVWLPESLATWRLHGNQASRKSETGGNPSLSTRDQAVNAALQRAKTENYLSLDLLEMIETFRDQSRQKTSIGKYAKILRAWDRIRGASSTYAKRANYVDTLYAAMKQEQAS